MTKASLLWCDLEMTGLEAGVDKILEVACIATDWDFNEIATFESAVKVDPKIIDQRMVGDFWNKFSKVKRALEKQNQKAEFTTAVVEQNLSRFVEANFDTSQPIYLAGNSVWKDHEFIRAEWPTLDKLLHYRMLDVSAWKVVLANKLHIEFQKPDRHRALDDIRGSIEEMREYLKHVS